MPRKKISPRKASIPIPIQFHPEITESTPTYYSNFVQVSHTPYEFSLTFAKIPSPPNVDQIAMAQAGKPVKIESLMQIAIPVKLMPGLLEALLNQKELYEKSDKKVNQSKQKRS